jgi:hypothetical protein
MAYCKSILSRHQRVRVSQLRLRKGLGIGRECDFDERYVQLCVTAHQFAFVTAAVIKNHVEAHRVAGDMRVRDN